MFLYKTFNIPNGKDQPLLIFNVFCKLDVEKWALGIIRTLYLKRLIEH